MHKIKGSELEKVEKLGFHIDNLTSETPELFLSKFTGLKLHELSQELSDILMTLTSPDIDRIITLDDPPPSVSIQFIYTGSTDPEKRLVFSRKFELDKELSVKHEYFDLPPSSRRKGTGKKVLNICLKQYINMGVVKIYVHAALQDGGYVWARAGFKALYKQEMKEILDICKKKLPPLELTIVKGIFDDYYSNDPEGSAFPIEDWSRLPSMENILRGSSWHGRIDLSDSQEFNNFRTYVS